MKQKIDELEKEYGDLEVFMEKDSSWGFLRRATQGIKCVSKMIVVEKPEVHSDAIFDTQEEAEKFISIVRHPDDDDSLQTQEFILLKVVD